jgi:hypothetical protein
MPFRIPEDSGSMAEMTLTQACWLSLLLAATGCGGDDDGGGGPSSPVAQSCYSLCSAQYKDCPDFVDKCRQLCDAVINGFSSECQDHAKAYYDCGAGIEWTCQGITAQQADSTQCSAELSAYGGCFKT